MGDDKTELKELKEKIRDEAGNFIISNSQLYITNPIGAPLSYSEKSFEKESNKIDISDLFALSIAACEKADEFGKDCLDRQNRPYFKHFAKVALSILVIDEKKYISEKLVGRKAKHTNHHELLTKVNEFLEGARKVGILHDLIEDFNGKEIEVSALKSLGFKTSVPENLISISKTGKKVVTVGFDLLHGLGLEKELVDAVKILTKDKQKTSYNGYLQQLAESGNKYAIVVKYFDLLHNNSSERMSGDFYKGKGYDFVMNKRSEYKDAMKKLRPHLIKIFTDYLQISPKIVEESFMKRKEGVFIATHALPKMRRDLFQDDQLDEKIKFVGKQNVEDMLGNNKKKKKKTSLPQIEINLIAHITAIKEHQYDRNPDYLGI